MGRQQIFELVIFGFWLAIAVVLCIHYSGHQNVPAKVPSELLPKISKSEVGKTFEVRKVTVIRGDTFDLTIRDGDDSRILAKLPVTAVENAKGKVLDLLNNSTKPKIVLRGKQSDGRWMVDFFFTSEEEQEINLSRWLITNKLVYK